MDRSRLDFVPSGINTTPRDTAMARANKKPQLIEFKGTTLPVVSVTLRSLLPADLARTATELFGDETFFDGDAAVLELDQIEGASETTADWTTIRAIFNHHGLQVIGVRGDHRRITVRGQVPDQTHVGADVVGQPIRLTHDQAGQLASDAVDLGPHRGRIFSRC